MEIIQEEWGLLQLVLDLLENHLGKRCEIALHDLTKSYDHTIVDIRNGHITGRKIGDCGSNIGLEVIRGTVKDDSRFNYITNTKDGKIIRSSTVFLKNKEQKIIGAICINTDITEGLKSENYLHEENQYFDFNTNVEEVFVSNVNELLEFFLNNAAQRINKPALIMTKEDKLKVLKELDEKGVFLISKSSERVCEYLNISKFTLYAYLEQIKKEINVK